MARVRMIAVFDLAKKLGGLVCGTENKSEHYLGYFTRFGDSASDIEPLCHLYKTQIRQYATALGIPNQIITKAPSAGLWEEQTDEQELGFTYEQADIVIAEFLGETEENDEVSTDIRQKVVARIQSQQFKLEVPYMMS
jgi:NAD+ synthase